MLAFKKNTNSRLKKCKCSAVFMNMLEENFIFVFTTFESPFKIFYGTANWKGERYQLKE